MVQNMLILCCIVKEEIIVSCADCVTKNSVRVGQIAVSLARIRESSCVFLVLFSFFSRGKLMIVPLLVVSSFTSSYSPELFLHIQIFLNTHLTFTGYRCLNLRL